MSMYKITYHLGRLNRYINMKFQVFMRNSKGIDSVQRKSMSGNDYLQISGTYPAICIELIDETKEYGDTWSQNKFVSIGKYSAFKFVESGYKLLEEIKNHEDLCVYENGILMIN